jgi:murein DD-endopeptidase MepM/ murein hydrolase activator NlpD
MSAGVPRFSAQEVSFRAVPTFSVNPVSAGGAVLTDDGSSGLFAALSDDLTAVSGSLQRLLGEKVSIESEQAGRVAGAESGFDVNQLDRTDASIAGQNFVRGAMTSYSAQLEMARDEAFNRFQLDYEKLPDVQKDPSVLADQYKGFVEGVATALPSDLQAAYRQSAMARANPAILQASKQYLDYQERQGLQDGKAQLSLLEAAILKNPLPKNDVELQAQTADIAEYKSVLGRLGLSEFEQKLAIEGLQGKLKKESVYASFEQAPDKLDYLEAFMQSDDNTYAFEERQALVQRMQAYLSDEDYLARKRQVELTFKQRLSLELLQNDIEQGIEDGQLDEKDVVQFAEQYQNYVTPDWTANQLTRINQRRRQGIEDENEILSIQRGTTPVDPSSSHHKKLLNTMYERALGGSSGVPVQGASVTSGFGLRAKPNASASSNHLGVDYAAPAGTPIRATIAGKVTFSGVEKGYGNKIVVQQLDGHTLVIAHNMKNSVKTGDEVKAGQILGLVGKTGNATGPHAHIEVLAPNGNRVDPEQYFGKKAAVAPLSESQMLRETTALMKRYNGFVPDLFKNQTMALLHSQNPTDQTKAFQRFNFLLDNGLSVSAFGKDEEALIHRVHADSKRGIPLPEAIKTARFQMDPNNLNLVKGNEERLKKGKILQKAENQPEKLFVGQNLFEILPGVPKGIDQIPIHGGVRDGLHADWEKLFSDAYIRTGGSEDGARAIATKQIQQMYGFTKIDKSPRLMKFPPEKYYKIYETEEKNSEWLRKDLTLAIKYKTKKPIPLEKVFLISDVRTAREASAGRPTYALKYINENGELDEIRLNGKPQRYIPDIDGELKNARQKAQQDARASIVEGQAVRKRALIRQNEPPKFNMLGK